MYLNAKKHVSGFSFEPEAKRKTFNALVRAAGLTKKEIKDGCSAEVTFDVGYWRKANQIHILSSRRRIRSELAAET